MRRTANEATIMISIVDGQPVFVDSTGNVSKQGEIEKFNTKIRPNGKISWVAGGGIEEITDVKIISGKDQFLKLPFEKKKKLRFVNPYRKYWFLLKIMKKKRFLKKFQNS